MNDRIWIEISKSRIKNNLQTIRHLIGDQVLLAPCVKANAYGHGIVEISRLVLEYGANWLCVDSIGEAEVLREGGILQPLLIMGYVQRSELPKILKLDSKIFLYNLHTAQALSGIAQKARRSASVHIKVDTGMSRQGIPTSEVIDFVNQVRKLPNLKVEGIATHFATADNPKDKTHFQRQLASFRQIFEDLKKEEIHIPIFHCCNSAATLLYPEAHFDLVRPGLSIYGYYPSQAVRDVCAQKNIKLLPALTLKTKITQIKEIPEGSCVSYGCTFVTERKTKIAILPIGYYDGLDRKLSNCGYALINGQKAKILGRVCMNMTIVDVTEIGDAAQEDEVVLIGRQGGEEISVEEMADLVGTINYEIITRLRESISRYYVD